MRSVGFIYRKDRVDKTHWGEFASAVSHRGDPVMTSVASAGMLDVVSHESYHISADIDIYNTEELATILSMPPYTSAKQLILLGYIKKGLSFFERLQGKWSVCIYDSAHQQVICSRDRLGMNSIYLHQSRTSVFVASELGQLIAIPDIPLQWNKQKIGIHLEYSCYNTDEETIWENITQVLPGHHVTICLSTGTATVQRYYDLRQSSAPDRSAVQQLQQSIATHSKDKSTYSVLLSGGLDSSIVARGLTAQGTPITSVSYIDKEYSEEPYVDAFLQQYPHLNTKVKITDEEWLSKVTTVTHAQEVPLATLSIIAHYELLKVVSTSSQYMLNGQGADTVFAGNIKNWAYLSKGYLARHPVAAWQLLSKYSSTLKQRYLLKQFPKITTIADPTWSQPTSVKEYMLQLIEERGLRDLLYREDRNSTVHGVQARYPFVDHKVLEAAYWLPDTIKIRGLQLKAVLHDYYKDKLPKAILQRQKSYSFDTPEFRLYHKGVISLEQEYKLAKEQLPSLIRDLDTSSIPDGEHKIYLAWRFYFLNRWLALYKERP